MDDLTTFLARRRLNYIDLVGFLLLFRYIAADRPFFAFISFVAALVLSVTLERQLYGNSSSRNGRPQ